MNRISPIAVLLFSCFLMGCSGPKKGIQPQAKLPQSTERIFQEAAAQYKLMKKRLPADRFPKTYYEQTDRFQTAASSDWVSGFYPGTLLYLYEQTKDTSLLNEAERILSVLEKEKNNKATHDLGFMMFCSFGNAERIAYKPEYQAILLTSARSLSTRFNPKVGCIKSWDRVRSLDGKTELTYPVIIDNLMNLELLFYASRVTGDTTFKHIALSHARTTINNHLRPDYSSYHVVNYDAETGSVMSRETHQGFADNSTWARGQAWGIYGFTVVYRESKEKTFLQTAERMADYFLAHLPKDTIPNWDFNVNQLGFVPKWKYDPSRFSAVPKDASAAAVAASALIELSSYVRGRQAQKYLKAAEDLLHALSSFKYKAAIGSNGNFILKHSTGNAPAYSEIDVPLTYADYYYVEALKRYKQLREGKAAGRQPLISLRK